MNIYQSKIDVAKFDGMNNFGMWRCNVMGALMTLKLKDALRLEEKPEEISEKKLGQDE